jgi:integrase/recombinase XerD
LAGAAVMSGWGSMAERVAAYLEARRAMGYQLRIEGEQLQRFARFADQQDHRGPLTLDLGQSVPYGFWYWPSPAS